MGKMEFNLNQVQQGVFTVQYCLNGEQLRAEEPAYSQEEAETQLEGRLQVAYSGQDWYLGTLKTESKVVESKEKEVVEPKDDIVKKLKKNFR